MAKRDYYDILEIPRNATEAEIKRAYRRLAKKLHPDQNKGDKDAEKRFKETQEAYSVLSDKEKRERYDRLGHAGMDARFNPGGQSYTWTSGPGAEKIDLGDLADMFNFGGSRGNTGGGGSIFDQIFGGGGRTRTAPSGTVPRDIEYPVSLRFEDAIRGTKLDLELSTAGQGTQRISVHIPPGVGDGQKIRVRGQGQPGRGHRPAGDLYVVCKIQPHAYFERKGDDIYLTVPITIREASLGAKVDLPTINGKRTVTIPPGTPSGTKLRLTGQGVSDPKEKKQGDQYAIIKIVPPKKPSAKQRELLEALGDLDDGSPRDGLWS
ncbi:MAG: J domain-containing protein [Phycisphaerales bacterium]|nr:J domain-containing protein [Phycisphaerales bacterium]